MDRTLTRTSAEALDAATERGGLGLNARSWALADRLVGDARGHGVVELRLDNGTRVIDAGASAPGGLEAGRLLAEICMGGLGVVSFAPVMLGGESWPGVHVYTDHPATSCMAAQYAGWAIDAAGYRAMGSGPLRAVARVERDLFDHLGYAERAERGVLVLETKALPNEEVAAWIAERSGLRPGAITLVVARTASPAGTVQIVARAVETALHKLHAVGFDVTRVVNAIGSAPLPPLARGDLAALGRTNDAILYGARTHLTVRASDDELAALIGRLPASASADYGTAFVELFERYDHDFYRIDPLLFSPAEVWLTSADTGRTFHGGAVNAPVLRASFGLEAGAR